MGRDVTSVLNDAHDLLAAFKMMDDVSLIFTGRGRFQARVTYVALQHLQLSAVEENIARIAFVKVPADIMLVSFLVGRQSMQTWGGLNVGAGELVAVGPDAEITVRTKGPCHWGVICSPVEQFAQFSHAVSGTPAPSRAAISVWRPLRSRISRLRHFHAAAIRTAHQKWEILGETEAVRGLEQELTHSMIECMAGKPASAADAICQEQQKLALQFHHYLARHGWAAPNLLDCCAALRVSVQTLCEACQEQVGMGPDEYVRLLRSQSAMHQPDAT